MSLNRIMIVGEAYGEEEEQAGRPFVGPSGRELNRMLAQVGIVRDDSFVTNVFNLRPYPRNDVENLCGPKAEALSGFPPLKSGKYVRAEYAPQIHRLYAEIKAEEPNVIIALGASAAWALLGTSGIKKIRGAPAVLSGPALAAVGRGVKVLPTYHPAAILREWSLRAIAVADLEKAAREAAYPEIRRPSREIWTAPTIADLAHFETEYIWPAPALSVDIETAADQITCIGFAPTVDRAIVIPFVDPMQKDGNYWRSLDDELKAWSYVKRWLLMTVRKEFRPKVYQSMPYKPGVGQNFNYDMHRIWRGMGLIVANEDDTMLLHHALQPEMEKGLGFLGTAYTDELPWKFMRAKHETLKKED